MSGKFTALIVEDVKDTSDYILDRVKKLCPEIGKIDQAFKLDEAYKKLQKSQYDIVF